MARTINPEPNERQVKILKFLNHFMGENGFPPTIREIGEHISVNSTSQVTYYLKQLEKKDLIERGGHTSRGIRLLDKAFNYVPHPETNIRRIRISGPIVASEPIPMPDSDVAYFDEETTVEVPQSHLPRAGSSDDIFALEVRGDSMIDAMVNDGDIVILRKTSTADNGDMVAVWLNDDNETTLKYFHKEENRIRLQPANPTMAPIYVDNTEQVEIKGKVILVIRQLDN